MASTRTRFEWRSVFRSWGQTCAPGTILVAMLLALPLCVTPSVRAAGETPPQTRTELDEQLLDELSLEISPAAQPDDGKSPRSETTEPENDLVDALEGGEDLGAGPEDPLQRIANQMQKVQERIASADTSQGTRNLQQAIVDDLDALIQQCKKAQSNQTGQGNKPGQSAAAQAGSQPANDSSTELQDRPAERPEPGTVNGTIKEAWGHLPARVRDAMVQSGVDQFLPKYQQLIEDYFRSLAQQPANR